MANKHGVHYTLDMVVDKNFPNSSNSLIALHAAVSASKATAIESMQYNFSNGGYSGIIMLAESHVSIHTWPEDNYISVDMYTCGDTDCEAGVKAIIDCLKPTKYTLQKLVRKRP